MTTQGAGEKARERLKALAASLRKAAKHPGKAESIHHLRVSIRRFTQVLKVFDDQFDHARKMRHRLRGLMDLCGEARNCDVALEVLEAAGVPAGHTLTSRLKRRRVRAGKDLAKLLEDWDVGTTVRRWRDWLKAKPGDRLTGDRLDTDMLPPLQREFRRSGVGATRANAPYKRMHKFRLLVKRFRYTLEILGSSEAQISPLRGLQERLGAINDCVTTSALISDSNLKVSDQRRIIAALNRLLAHRSMEFRLYWKAHFGRKRTRPRAKRRTG
jgi:CHAD domain-containing protein